MSSTSTVINRNGNEIKVHHSEIDNHADKHCFGENFIPYAWTRLECKVSPFLDEYQPLERVPICAGATAYTFPNGHTVILIFGQGLWFGGRM